jgi:programmed cell death 6-interacting protein
VVPRYFRLLTSVENRFPISRERGHAAVSFVWYDAFRPKTKTSQSNIHFEKSAVLFNLGACLNQSALACDRTAADGLQQACKLFQVR